MEGVKGMFFVDREELLDVFPRIMAIITKGDMPPAIEAVAREVCMEEDAKPGSLFEKIFYSIAMAYCFGKSAGSQVKKAKQGPRTFEEYMVGQQLTPTREEMQTVSRIMERYPEEPIWGGMQTYTLGYIHGKREGRKGKSDPSYEAIQKGFKRLRKYWERGEVCLIPELDGIRERYWKKNPKARTEDLGTKLFLTFADGYMLGREAGNTEHQGSLGAIQKGP